MKMIPNRKILALVATVALGMGALECAAAPKVQCSYGATKVTHSSKGSKTYHCHNGEWIQDPR